jgi:hypothetical protein
LPRTPRRRATCLAAPSHSRADGLKTAPRALPEPIAQSYLSLSAFYAADPARRNSHERDMGLSWRSARGLFFRAAWVEATGELYLVRRPLGRGRGGSVHLLAGTFGRAKLERRLVGWREQCGRPRSLEWLLARASGGDDGPGPRPQRLGRPAPAAA